MAEVVDLIAEVETKTLPTGVTIYLVKAGGKEFSTRDRAIAQVAYQTVGKYGLIDYTEKKNDKGYVNRYLNHFAPVDDGGPPEPRHSDPQFDEVQPLGGGFDPGPEPKPPGLFDDSVGLPTPAMAASDKDLSIAKAVALKASVETLQYLPVEQRSASGIIEMAEFYARWLQDWRP